MVSDEKPNCCFSPGVHTPLVESPTYKYRYLDIKPIPLKERIELVNFYLPAFNVVLSQRKFDFKTVQGYKDLISKDAPPEKYLMKFEDFGVALVFGRMIKEGDVPEGIARNLWGTA